MCVWDREREQRHCIMVISSLWPVFVLYEFNSSTSAKWLVPLLFKNLYFKLPESGTNEDYKLNTLSHCHRLAVCYCLWVLRKHSWHKALMPTYYNLVDSSMVSNSTISKGVPSFSLRKVCYSVPSPDVDRHPRHTTLWQKANIIQLNDMSGQHPISDNTCW